MRNRGFEKLLIFQKGFLHSWIMKVGTKEDEERSIINKNSKYNKRKRKN